MPNELATWSAGGDDHELAAGQVDRLLQPARHPHADVRQEVLRALLPEGLVPLNVDAQASDRIVTLVGWEQEREDAKLAAGCVPGVLGIIEDLVRLPRPGAGEAAKEEVAAALVRTTVADAADLTVDEPCPGTVVLSGGVRSRRDHDLAIATAASATGVGPWTTASTSNADHDRGRRTA